MSEQDAPQAFDDQNREVDWDRLTELANERAVLVPIDRDAEAGAIADQISTSPKQGTLLEVIDPGKWTK